MDYSTAGDAQGQALVAVVTGVPAGLRLSKDQVESDLRRCVAGYQASSAALASVEIESGMWGRNTTGAPVAFLIYGDEPSGAPAPSAADVACPGRGDMPAVLKTAADATGAVAARFAALDEAACVVAAAVPREFLAQLGVEIGSFVTRIGAASYVLPEDALHSNEPFNALDVEFSAVRCPDPRASQEMLRCLQQAREAGETLGGTFQVVVSGLLPGLGDFAQRHRRLGAQIAGALFSLPGVVAVEFGAGAALAAQRGPQCHDALVVDPARGFSCTSNWAGGIEGGLTTGAQLRISVAVAPCAPTAKGAPSVNIDTLQPALASAPAEATPTCTVAGVAVAAEAEVAFVLANAYFDQFGSANMTDICAAVDAYAARLRRAAR